MTSYRVADDVAFLVGSDIIVGDTAVYVLRVPDGAPLVLDGSASLIWQAALLEGDTVGLVAAAVEVEPHTIADDVTGFLRHLVAEGYLLCDDEAADFRRE